MSLRKMGYLMRLDKGVFGQKWVRRFYMLKNGFLLCYKEKDSEIYPEQIIPIRRAAVHDASAETGKAHSFEVRHPKLKQAYYVRAASAEDAEDWMIAVREIVSHFELQGKVLNLRRESERNAVKEIDQRDTSEGLYIINAAWMTEWMEFTAEGSLSSPPGPINNNALLKSVRPLVPRRGLLKGRNYRIVNKATWRILMKIYSGGPIIRLEDFQAAMKMRGASANVEVGADDIVPVCGAPPPPPPTSAPPPPPDLNAQTGDDEQSTGNFEGFMYKAKKLGRLEWQKRWFTLGVTSGVLTWYKSKGGEKKGDTNIADCTSRILGSASGHENVFMLVSPRKPYYLATDTAVEQREWIQALDAAKLAASELREAERLEKEKREPPVVVGIGVILRHDPSGCITAKIIENGPADRSQRMQVGDRVMAVDDVETPGLDFNRVLEMIRGEQGTFVKLWIQRIIPGEEEPTEFDVELRRDVVKRVALYGNQPAAPSSPAAAGSGVSTPSPAFKKAGMLG